LSPRGREAMAKRARERARQERQQAKKQRRQAAAEAAASAEIPDEGRLMEEFRVLSEKHAAGQIAHDVYEKERNRIFDELGIENQ